MCEVRKDPQMSVEKQMSVLFLKEPPLSFEKQETQTSAQDPHSVLPAWSPGGHNHPQSWVNTGAGRVGLTRELPPLLQCPELRSGAQGSGCLLGRNSAVDTVRALPQGRESFVEGQFTT